MNLPKDLIGALLFVPLLLRSVQLNAQTSPDKTISIHSLTTGLNLPNIAKLNNIVVDEQRRRAYFTGDLSDYIGVVDIDSLKMVQTLDAPVKGFVWKRLTLNPATGTLFMLFPERNQLYRIDPSTGISSGPFDFQGNIAVDSKTNRLFVTSGANSIRVYNDTFQLLDSIQNVVAAFDLKTDTSQGKLYVLHSTTGPDAGVSVYNTSSLQFIRKYSLPSDFSGLPRRICVSGGKIYLASQPPNRMLALIDETTGNAIIHSITENLGEMKVYDGRLYLMTGYPYYSGYLPNADGSYGIIEIRDAATGEKLQDLWCDLETLYFDFDKTTGRLLYSSTGRGVIGIVRLSDYTTIKKTDVCTVIDKILVYSSDGSLVAQNRLGGSTVCRINPSTGELVNTFIPGNWPTDIALDETRNRLYVLSHYEAKVSAFDLSTNALVVDIPLMVQRGRTDGLSSIGID